MKRVLMQAYVKGSNEAVALYLKAFNGTLGYHVKKEDGTFYHSELNIEGHILSVAEVDEEQSVTGNTMQFCLHYEEGEEEKVRQAYEILKEGSKVIMPLGPCDFSSLCTDFIDRFGVRWCLFI